MTIWKRVAGDASISCVTAAALALGLGIAGVFTLAAIAIIGAPPASAKPVKPGEDGLGYCILRDQGDGEDESVVGPNKCCYEERQNDQDDMLTVCLQCDANWKNCEEVESARGKTRAGPARTGGSISEPAGKPKRRKTGNGGGVLK